MKTEVPFAMQEGKGASPQNSQETLINLYAEPDLGRKQLVRRQRPGISRVDFYGSVGGQPMGIERFTPASYVFSPRTEPEKGGVLVFVIGGYLWVQAEIDPSAAFVLAQEIPGILDGNPVTIEINDNDQLLISDGVGLWYVDNPGDAPLPTTTVGGAGTITMISGYGVFNEPGTARFYLTDLNDATTVDPLNFATAESYTDNILRVFRHGNDLALFGETSTEFWALSGGTDFPLSPITNAVIRRGIRGPLAVIAEDNSTFFVGDDDIAYRLEGYRPARISTHSIERLIQALPDDAKRSCRALVYTHEGAKFITFTWPGYLTLQYNAATGLWNRAKSYNKPHLDLVGSAIGSSRHFLSSDTILCELDPDQFHDNTYGGGDVYLERRAISAPGDAGGRKITVQSVRLDVEVGRTEPFNRLPFGGADALVDEPQIMLRVARDGETFGNERWRGLGKIGNFRKHVMWRDLGQGERPTLEVSVTDPCRLTIMGSLIELDVEQ